MADYFVTAVALLLALVFSIAAMGFWSGLERLSSFARMRARYGAAGVRIIYLILAAMMYFLAAMIWFQWQPW